MKKQAIFIALGALFIAGVAPGATTYNLTFSSVNNPTTGKADIGYGSYYISPYTGTLKTTTNGVSSTSTVGLFCDDFNHEVHVGDSFAVNEYLLSDITGDAQSVTNARFYSQSVSGRPTGTVLYQELAWLYAQMNAKSLATIDSIQEAAWSLTSTSAVNNPSAPANNNAAFWRQQAATYYNNIAGGVSAGYSSVNYGQWAVLTDPTTGSTAKQEFLINTAGYQVIPSPEPATFALFGGTLLVLSVAKRRKIQAAFAKKSR